MNNNPPPKKRRYKHFFIFLLLLTSTFFNYKGNPLQPTITEEELFEMLNNGEVERIVLVTKEKFVKVTLTEEALKKDEHDKKLNTFSNPKNKSILSRLAKAILSEDNVHYTLKILSSDIFDRHLTQFYSKKENTDKIGYIIDDEANLSKELSGLLNILIFFILLWTIFGPLIKEFTKDINLLGIGNSKAILRDKENKVKTTFKDVGGMLEAKEELKEIVDFLKNPKKYTQLGGRIPKGALLIGAPGNGKTLLAKAVAGEAGVPFFSSSGSDYVAMFVGAGSARIRHTFKQARKAGKENHASIVFIDEIDSIGKSRRQSIGDGVTQDGENTLNALLTEMDGFKSDNINQNTIIVLAATNRVEILDKALLRPGRFDRQIRVDNPTLKDREAILKLHMKGLKLSNNVSAAMLATQTVGCSGAFIANLCNEAALYAARKNRKKINMNDFQTALDRCIGGLEKKEKIISDKEKIIVAQHEAGHAVVSWFTEHAEPLVKVTVVPRGGATLGYAQYLPKEQFIYQQIQIQAKIDVLLAGRVAEKIRFNQLSTGAQNDLEHLTHIVYNMVAVYGMSKEVGHVSFRKAQEEQVYNFTKPYAEATSKIIDTEVRKIIATAYKRVQNLLEKNKEALSIIANALLKKEVLYRKDLEKLIGVRPFEKDKKKITPKV